MKALEVIVYGAHKELLSDEMKEASSWESKVKQKPVVYSQPSLHLAGFFFYGCVPTFKFYLT